MNSMGPRLPEIMSPPHEQHKNPNMKNIQVTGLKSTKFILSSQMNGYCYSHSKMC